MSLQHLHLLTVVPGVQEVVAAVTRGGAEAAATVPRAVSLPLQSPPPGPAPAPPRVTRVTRAAGEVEARAETEGLVEQARLAPGSQAWKKRN